LFLVHRFLSPWWRRRQVPPKRRLLQEPHGVTTQKTPFFMILIVLVAEWSDSNILLLQMCSAFFSKFVCVLSLHGLVNSYCLFSSSTYIYILHTYPVAFSPHVNYIDQAPSLVSDVSNNFYVQTGVAWSAQWVFKAVTLGFLCRFSSRTINNLHCSYFPVIRDSNFLFILSATLHPVNSFRGGAFAVCWQTVIFIRFRKRTE
jgi:hypothetical protein